MKGNHHPDFYFNESLVQKTKSQKHLGVILDEKLSFKDHMDHILVKTTKCIAALRKLRFFLPPKSLITIYESFIRSHLDYGEVIYDSPNSLSFQDKLKSI